MGNQKWTPTEEQALLAGVAKHGEGKWMNILNDPEFSSALSDRSNVDLEDKWRNPTIGTSGQVATDQSGSPQVKSPPDCSAGAGTSPEMSAGSPIAVSPFPKAPSSAPATSHGDGSSQMISTDPLKDAADDDISPPRYNDELIFEALTSINDANGSSIGAILSFIQQKHEVQNRRVLDSKLRRLVRQGKLEKVENLFKLCNETTMVAEDAKPDQSNNPSSSISKETLDDAAETAAKLVAEAEHKSFFAEEAIKRAEVLAKISEQAQAMIRIAKAIHERCYHDVISPE